MKSHANFTLALTSAALMTLSIAASEPPITALTFAPNAKHVVTVSQSGIKVFSWPDLDLNRTIRPSTSNLHCLSFSPNHNYLAVGGGSPSEEGVVEVFSWPEGKPLLRFNGHDDSVRSVIWQNDAQLISGSIDRDIKLWHLGKETNALTTLKGHSRSVDAICLIENGQTLVSTGADRSLRVWAMSSKTLIRSLNQHTKAVNALSPRPGSDGLPIVASAAQDRTIRFWQPSIGRMLRYIRLESEPLAIAWTNDGARLLAACVDGHVRLINPLDVSIIHEFPTLEGWAYAIAMHPYDQSAAVGGINGQVRRLENPAIQGTRGE